MSSGSISKGVYPPVVQMRSPGCQDSWIAKHKKTKQTTRLHPREVSGLSVGAFNPNPLRRDLGENSMLC